MLGVDVAEDAEAAESHRPDQGVLHGVRASRNAWTAISSVVLGADLAGDPVDAAFDHRDPCTTNQLRHPARADNMLRRLLAEPADGRRLRPPIAVRARPGLAEGHHARRRVQVLVESGHECLQLGAHLLVERLLRLAHVAEHAEPFRRVFEPDVSRARPTRGQRLEVPAPEVARVPMSPRHHQSVPRFERSVLALGRLLCWGMPRPAVTSARRTVKKSREMSTIARDGSITGQRNRGLGPSVDPERFLKNPIFHESNHCDISRLDPSLYLAVRLEASVRRKPCERQHVIANLTQRPGGLNSRPARQGRQPEASLAWSRDDPGCEA